MNEFEVERNSKPLAHLSVGSIWRICPATLRLSARCQRAPYHEIQRCPATLQNRPNSPSISQRTDTRYPPGLTSVRYSLLGCSLHGLQGADEYCKQFWPRRLPFEAKSNSGVSHCPNHTLSERYCVLTSLHFRERRRARKREARQRQIEWTEFAAALRREGYQLDEHQPRRRFRLSNVGGYRGKGCFRSYSKSFLVSGGNLQQHERTFNASCDIPIALLLPAGHA